MRRRVVVTGLGCISPLGNDVDSLWGNILAGKSGVGMITHYDTSQHKTKFAAQVKDFDAVELFGKVEARRMDPLQPVCRGSRPASGGRFWFESGR